MVRREIREVSVHKHTQESEGPSVCAGFLTHVFFGTKLEIALISVTILFQILESDCH